MDKIEKIRNRINKKDVQKPKKNKLLSFTNFCLFLAFLGVGTLTYCKVDENATLFNNLFKTDFSFVEMNDNIDEYLDHLFNKNQKDDELVSFENEYIDVGNNNYQTKDKVVNMINDGKVVSLNYHSNYKYFIVIQYVNGVVGMYTLIDETTISVNQELTKNEIIGNYEGDYFNCVFKKGQLIIDYKDAI